MCDEDSAFAPRYHIGDPLGGTVSWMKNGARGILLLLVALTLLLSLPFSAQAVSYSAEEIAFVTLLNNYRVSQGLQPLLVSDMISEACDRHNSDMGKYSFFDHYSLASDYFPVGASPWNRMVASGYNYNTSWGENIAAGYSTAAAVFEGWRNSSGHNANMLGASYKVLGVSMVDVSGSPYGYYWTTDFGGYVDPSAHSLTDPTPTDPVLTITSPSGSGTYASGDSLSVNWTTDRNLSSGEFGVWVRSATQNWYIGQLVPASGGKSFSKTITLSLPAGKRIPGHRSLPRQRLRQLGELGHQLGVVCRDRRPALSRHHLPLRLGHLFIRKSHDRELDHRPEPLER